MQAVLDIGKTHVKLVVVDSGNAVANFNCKNAPIAGMYPQADVNYIWNWICETLSACSYTKEVKELIVTTHGATAALVDINSDAEDGLALPVLDYEYTGIDECIAAYQSVRPEFSETLSPALPAGLNLGKQLFWLQQQYPEQFAQADHIVMYPQYWAWRFGARLVTEVTSLGCHTDLWRPASGDYSSLVEHLAWREKMPPLAQAWDHIGVVSDKVSAQTGLSTTCKIYAGIHDSNASYLRYLEQDENKGSGFTVISTGTWTILMQAGGDPSQLANSKDTLANVDINGSAVCCARFMGGREYERICARLGGNISMAVSADDIQQAIAEGWMVTPDFSEGNGPFGGQNPRLLCPEKPHAPQAIATLYCALMINQRLEDLQASGDIYIEGAFLKNPLLCALVAQLRPNQKVYLSADNTGTVMGAAALIDYQTKQHEHIALSYCDGSQ